MESNKFMNKSYQLEKEPFDIIFSPKEKEDDEISSTISDHPTRYDSGNLQIKWKPKKKVRFNPLVTVVNIKSYKNENHIRNFFANTERKHKDDISTQKNNCDICSIF